jgi:threonine dehydrogenase-like Zn-dependent dehydrogenase
MHAASAVLALTGALQWSAPGRSGFSWSPRRSSLVLPEVSLECATEINGRWGAARGDDRPRCFDVVIEAAGSGSARQRSVGLARPGGTVVVLGVYEPDGVWPQCTKAS